jgi:hypothetical protein
MHWWSCYKVKKYAPEKGMQYPKVWKYELGNELEAERTKFSNPIVRSFEGC